MGHDFPMSKESFIRCTPKQETLEQAITTTINRYSAENGSNTPDYILANYLMNCLAAYNKACIWRAKWFSPDGVPLAERNDGPQPPYEMGALTKRPGELTPPPDTEASPPAPTN